MSSDPRVKPYLDALKNSGYASYVPHLTTVLEELKREKGQLQIQADQLVPLKNERDQLQDEVAGKNGLLGELRTRVSQLEQAVNQKAAELTNLRLLQQQKTTEVETLQGKVQSLSRLAPKKDIRGNPLGFYDIIIDMQGLQDAYQEGWPIYFSDDDKYALFKSKTPSFVASITGDFNSGKSYILSEISGRTFQSGDRVHTVGISIKLVNLTEQSEPEADPSRSGQGNTRGKKAYFIDTQGLNSPVMPSKRHSVAAGQFVLEQELQETKALEEFQRQVVLSVSDLFMFVVGQLSAKNQLDLHILIKAIKVLRKRFRGIEQRVFILHNLRDWTHEQFEAEKYLERIQNVYAGMLHSEVSCEGFEYLWGHTMDEPDSSNDGVRIRFEHLFLTRSGCDACQNDQVFNYIRNTMRSMELNNTCLAEKLGKAMHDWIPSFLHVVNSVPIPKLTVIESVADDDLGNSDLCEPGRRMGLYRHEEDLTQIQTTVRTRPLGSIVSLASDDLAYNITQIPCSIKAGRRGNQLRMMRLLCIEVPGLRYNSFKCLVNPISTTEADSDGSEDVNLIVVTSEPSVGKLQDDVVEIRVKAILESQPSEMNHAMEREDEMPTDGLKTIKLYHKLEQSSFGDVSGMEKYISKVVDKGTRSIDRNEQYRLVNFRAAFSEEEIGKWDRTIDPCYCYRDGVLSIGFVTSATVTDTSDFEVNSRSEVPKATNESGHASSSDGPTKHPATAAEVSGANIESNAEGFELISLAPEVELGSKAVDQCGESKTSNIGGLTIP